MTEKEDMMRKMATERVRYKKNDDNEKEEGRKKVTKRNITKVWPAEPHMRKIAKIKMLMVRKMNLKLTKTKKTLVLGWQE